MSYQVYIDHECRPDSKDYVKITKYARKDAVESFSSWYEARNYAEELRKRKKAEYEEHQEDIRPMDDSDVLGAGLDLSALIADFDRKHEGKSEVAYISDEGKDDFRKEPNYHVAVDLELDPGDIDFIHIEDGGEGEREEDSFYARNLAISQQGLSGFLMSNYRGLSSHCYAVSVSVDKLNLDVDDAFTVKLVELDSIRWTNVFEREIGGYVCLALTWYDTTANMIKGKLSRLWRFYRPESPRPLHPERMIERFSWLDLSDDAFRNAMVDARSYDEKCWLTVIAGSGGSGKSEIYKAVFADDPGQTLPMALTGFAADVLRDSGVNTCRTINGALNIAPEDWYEPEEEIPGLAYRMALWDTILIDEVSMASINLMDVLIRHLVAANRLRPKYKKPIKVVLFGDPLQLLPVIGKKAGVKYGEVYGKDVLFFNAPSFRAIRRKTHILHYSYRQKNDPRLSAILLRMRLGEVTEADVETLNTRVMTYEELSDLRHEKSLRMLAYDNDSIDGFNDRKCKELNSGNRSHITHRKMYLLAPLNGKSQFSAWPDTITLYIGDPVIVLKNDEYHTGLNRRYSNGTTGIVDDFTPSGLPVVKKASGEKVIIYRSVVQGDGERFTQLACKSAYAVTYHKAQGLTLDSVYLNLGADSRAMQEDMLYLGISRVKTLDGLGLSRKVTVKEMNSSLNGEALTYFRLDPSERDAVVPMELRFMRMGHVDDSFSIGRISVFASDAGREDEE